MILFALLGLAGAVMGVWIRPRLLAVPLAIGVAEGARGLIALAAPVAVDDGLRSFVGRAVLSIIGDARDDYLPLLGVSGGAALLAAVLGMLLDKRDPKALTLEQATQVRRQVQKGRFVRAQGMVETREAQAKAEERQKAILGL